MHHSSQNLLSVHANSNQQSAPVIILGMHRSGTSCLTGSLEAAGLFLGDTIHYCFDNQKGNRESERIMLLHKDIMQRQHSDWRNPKPIQKWTAIHTLLRDLLIDSYPRELLWGFKDPRTLFLLDGWLEALPNAQLVGIYRHPYLVAESLFVRNQMPHSEGLRLWCKYNLQLLSVFDKHGEFPILEFTTNENEFLTQLTNLQSHLQLKYDEGSFFEPSLRQNEIPEIPASSTTEEALSIYARLNTLRT